MEYNSRSDREQLIDAPQFSLADCEFNDSTACTVAKSDHNSDTEDGDVDETGVFTKINKMKKFAKKIKQKERDLERTPLLSGKFQASPGEESGSTIDHEQQFSSSDEEDSIRHYDENYGSVGTDDFVAVVHEAIRAIHKGVYPERIKRGSSGSYFVKNCAGENIGVFKPKNEEPYGQLNPKWVKWIHRIFFPCCFGRSCLLPNQGYLSEAGASLVDRKLGLNVVPQTNVVALAAPTFNYGRIDRAKARTKARIRIRYPEIGKHFHRVGLPPKTGSFQLFVHGHQDASYWLRQWELHPETAPSNVVMEQFQRHFEKMVIIDFIIRNTDRGNDNWLIKYETNDAMSIPQDPAQDTVQEDSTVGKPVRDANQEIHDDKDVMLDCGTDQEAWNQFQKSNVSIAAIDNGLAFPIKHPDEWRTYPYRWAWLPFAKHAFSDETIELVLPRLDETDFVRELCNDLRKIFQKDPGFDKKMFDLQLSVMRGQIFNLREALRQKKSPQQLVQMPPQLMVEVKQKKRHRVRFNIREKPAAESADIIAPNAGDDTSKTQSSLVISSAVGMDSKRWHDTYQQKVQTRSAFFTWW